MKIWTIDTVRFTNALFTGTIVAHFGVRIRAEIVMGGQARIIIHAQQVETEANAHYSLLTNTNNPLF